MHTLHRLIDDLLGLLAMIVAAILAAIGWVDLSLRRAMTHGGIPHDVQTVILVLVTIALVIGAVRMLGGVVRIAILVLLLLLLIQYFAPLAHV